MTKSKFDTTPGDIKERSFYPNGYYENGEWAGFFAGDDPEKTVIEWCKMGKGRTFNWVPRPKPEPVVVEKGKVVKSKSAPASNGLKTAPTSRRFVVKKKTASKKPVSDKDIDWNVDDIKDDEKMSKVAKKSQDEAIKKLKGKK